MSTSLNLRSGFRGAIRIPHIPRDLNGFGGKSPGRWLGKNRHAFQISSQWPTSYSPAEIPRDELAGLRSRIANHGSLTIWFTAKAIADWRAQPRATPGGQRHYSDLAIETALTLRAVFGLALRQTEGLVGSIMQLLGIDLPVPDHTTFSRRAGGLKVLQKPRASSDPLHLIIDSTGLKLRGAGESLFEKQGTAKRRAWRKLHIGIDADAGEIVASDLTDKDVDDASHVGPMLDQLSLAPTSFIGDGAYDRGAVSELLARRNPDMSVLVPPCKGAVPDRTRCRRRPNAIGTFWKLRNGVECIRKKPLGYNRRSKVEASIGRYKRVIGDALKSRADDRRKAEVAIAVESAQSDA